MNSARAEHHTKPPRYDVCSAVVSDLRYDARVWKQARSLAAAGYTVRLIGFTYEISEPIERSEDGIDSIELPFGSRTKVSKLRRAVSLLRLWVETLRTPARGYHCHNIHPGPAAWLAARIRRGALVYDAHELYGDPEIGSSSLRRIVARGGLVLERLMFRASDAIITTNESRARILQDRHGDRPVTVLPNVPPRIDEVQALDPGFPADRKILLFLGGVYEQHGIDDAIRALGSLEEVDLAILGFGREAELRRLRTLARDSGFEDRVHFFGPRPFTEMSRIAAAADIGLVPIRPMSINYRLGDTNKLHDYLMGGLPVVASDLPEIRRVVSLGDPPVGELYDPASSDSFIAAMRRLLSDDSYPARRREARRLVLEETNWEAVAPRLVGLYESLLAEPAAAGPDLVART